MEPKSKKLWPLESAPSVYMYTIGATNKKNFPFKNWIRFEDMDVGQPTHPPPTMVLMLDGNSEKGAYVQSETRNLICLLH